MPGRALKLYDEYLQRLELYAKASNILLVLAPEDSDGAYIPSRNMIRVDPDLTDSHQIAVILHELGHSLDDRLVDKKFASRVDRVYSSYYAGKIKGTQLEFLLDTERRAWEYGRAIAKITKIPLGQWYDAAKDYCLRTYHEDA